MKIDNVWTAVKVRVIKGLQAQDDLWIRSDESPSSYHRVDTTFKPMGDDKLLILVWEDEETLRSFLVTVTELDTE